MGNSLDICKRKPCNKIPILIALKNYETFYYVVSPSYLTSSLLDPDLFFKFFHFDLKFLFFPEAESQGFT